MENREIVLPAQGNAVCFGVSADGLCLLREDFLRILEGYLNAVLPEHTFLRSMARQNAHVCGHEFVKRVQTVLEGIKRQRQMCAVAPHDGAARNFTIRKANCKNMRIKQMLPRLCGTDGKCAVKQHVCVHRRVPSYVIFFSIP